ncbi:protein kinase [Rhodococcus ruber]|uniref:serine/threonine-protein kinase n=1 Tax=Rhodococcus TaxID=1827 RepID=UPI000E6B1C16|nr:MULTISPECIES: serine/threonine-protein kinase [Rhodococcus]MDO2376865.1 protein kinase [Rhodococcus ruber]AXY51090.1 serine/threonine-protein kinase [Rhodococcus ruber]QDC17005.1 protein kinase [Rhodococcus ruber]UQB75357.1 protein kinase [Rhodococcus ruber]WML65855.1 protein kinase [Rhodococcus sp. AH-ZY2]
MAENDPLATQRATVSHAAAAEDETVEDLRLAGFADATEIGRGGFGVVYRCRETALERTVAVKVLTAPLDADNLDRFLREQRAMGRLSGHPHIVTVLQVGTTGSGRPYLVMHYHPHDSLEARIRRYGPLPWPDVLRIGVKLAGALETAHRTDVLHRDVKPANILLTQYGEPQLTDFGIARIADGFRTSSGAITGSPAFTAPEILAGAPPTPAADVYGLAATLFCALTGHAAFERRRGEQVVTQFLRITTEPVPDLRGTGVPEEVCSALERGMATDPDARPQSAAEFGELLQRAQERGGCDVDEMALPADPDGPGPLPVPGTPHTTGPHLTPTSITTPPVPVTRFRPHAASRPLVPRTHLIDRLRLARRRRLVAIHAPTGFGKSTLAAQWREVLTAEGVAVAWLAVDRDDNDVVWFLTHLIEAFRQVRPQFARQLRQVLEAHGDDAERYVLSTLIDEIHHEETPMALVIEDWHLVTAPGTVAALDFLLDRGCHHLQLVVTSRSRAGLPLSRMRVLDELVEIDSEALRFDAEEAEGFLRDVSGLDLGLEDIRGLTEVTDGWVAALQLVSLSLRDSEDPTDLIENLSGRHHAIGEFLADNVLDTLEPEVYEFLLATSVTDEITGSLATALTGDLHGQAMLEQIEARDLFLRRVDDEGSWFRYHRLFADFLRRRLERDHPERVEPLHRAAAQWFAHQHMLREAVDHALSADDQELAVDIIAADGMFLIEHSHMTTLLALVAKLPPRVVATHPRLQMTVAWANALLQRANQTRTALAAARGCFSCCNAAAEDIAVLQVEADVVEGVVAVSTDRIADVADKVAPCLDDPDAFRPWVVSVAANVATFVDIYRFDFEAARRRQRWAEPYHRASNGPFSRVYGQCLLGIAANEQLDVAAAEGHFRAGLRAARKVGGIHTHAARLAAAMLGELLYEQGRITEAEALLDESHELGTEGGVPDFMIARFVTAARLKSLRGDRVAAAALLDEGARAADDYRLPRLRARVVNERVRLGLPGPQPAPRQMPDSDAPDPDGVAEITAQVEDATAIRLLYGSGRPEDAAVACEWARLWHRRVSGRGRRRAELQALRLLVACLHAAGRIEEAQHVLAPAVATCGRLGMLRYLVDGGAHVVPLLPLLRDRLRTLLWPPDWPAVDEAFLDEMVRLAEAGGASIAL